MFILRAHHIPRGIVKEDNGQIRLITQLDELRGFRRAICIDRTIVTNKATGDACDCGVTADSRHAVT